ncbi:hypothetical protein ScPMuIL_013079 [Solemya velum]
MEWSSLLVSIIASFAIILQSAQSEDKLNEDEINSLARIPGGGTGQLTNADGSGIAGIVDLDDLPEGYIQELLKRGSLFRFGKRGSLFRFGKRGALFRFGKRGSLFRFGKRADENEGYWPQESDGYGFEKPDDMSYLDTEADKRGSLFRFGKRAALFRYGRSADKKHTHLSVSAGKKNKVIQIVGQCSNRSEIDMSTKTHSYFSLYKVMYETIAIHNLHQSFYLYLSVNR